jgi:integrase
VDANVHLVCDYLHTELLSMTNKTKESPTGAAVSRLDKPTLIAPKQLQSGKWRIQVRRQNWPRIDEAHFVTEAEANARAVQLERLYGGRSPNARTLQEAWDEYLDSDTFSDKAERTQASELRTAKHWLPRLGQLTLRDAEARPQVFVQYRQERRKAKYKRGNAMHKYGPNQVRLELASISSLMNYAREQAWIQRNPLLGMKRPAKKAEERRVTKVQQGLVLLAVVNKELRDVDREAARYFALQQEFGARPGEMAKLLKSDVDLADKLLCFRGTKTSPLRYLPLTKGQLDRLAEQLVWAALKEGDTPSPYVWSTLGKDGNWKPYNYSSWWKALRKLGFVEKGSRPHDGRHEHVSSAIENGIPADEIRLVTGHKSVQAFERYNHAKSTAKGMRAKIEGRQKLLGQQKLEAMAAAMQVSPEALTKFMAEQAKKQKR